VVPTRELAVLRANGIIAPLPAPQLESVARRVRWMTGKPGLAIIRQGDLGDRYYVLVHGALRVTKDGAFVRTVDRPGDGVGEIALIHGIPRTATVELATDCVLLTLERDDFLSVISTTGPVAVDWEVTGELVPIRDDETAGAGTAGASDATAGSAGDATAGDAIDDAVGLPDAGPS
jgi:hypothetical protein